MSHNSFATVRRGSLLIMVCRTDSADWLTGAAKGSEWLSHARSVETGDSNAFGSGSSSSSEPSSF